MSGRNATRAMLAALAVCCVGSIALGQANSSAGDLPALAPPVATLPETSGADLALPAVSDSYAIGPDDLLSIFVLKMPDYSRQERVASDGTIRLPLLAQPLRASGLTAQEVSDEITQALVQQRLAVAPTVQVVVRQVLSRPIVVSGAVRTPMVIQASRPMRLLEVLARAGGLGDTAGTTVLLTQNSASGPIARTLSLDKLTQTTDLEQDPILTGGEVIRVLPARMVYAVGAFLKPGAFPVRAGQPLTVLETVALAEGLSQAAPADKRHAEIIHNDADGTATATPVDIQKILKHKLPDLALQAGDVLYVPVNGRRKVYMAALSEAAQIAVFGIGYNAASIF